MGMNNLRLIRLLRAPSSVALNTARDGPPTAFLGNLFQYLTTLSVKNLFPTPELNLLFWFKTIPPCPNAICQCNKLPSLFFYKPLLSTEGVLTEEY